MTPISLISLRNSGKRAAPIAQVELLAFRLQLLAHLIDLVAQLAGFTLREWLLVFADRGLDPLPREDDLRWCPSGTGHPPSR